MKKIVLMIIMSFTFISASFSLNQVSGIDDDSFPSPELILDK